METQTTYTSTPGPVKSSDNEIKKPLLTQKQVNTLLMIGYAGIVISYGLLLYVKLKHATK